MTFTKLGPVADSLRWVSDLLDHHEDLADTVTMVMVTPVAVNIYATCDMALLLRWRTELTGEYVPGNGKVWPVGSGCLVSDNVTLWVNHDHD